MLYPENGIQILIAEKIERTALEKEYSGAVFFYLDASRMTDRESLMSEFAERLAFPGYFGRNWDSLEECLLDMDDRTGEKKHVLIINNPELISDRTLVKTLLEVCSETAEQWKTCHDGDSYIKFVFAAKNSE